MKIAKRIATGIVATSLLLAGTALAQDEIKLAVADLELNPTTDSVLTLAVKLGIFEKHDVKVTMIALSGTPQAAIALNTGDVDLAHISIDAAVRLRAENDVPLRGIASPGLGIPYLIASKEDITSVEELAGKAFAIADNGSLDHTLTKAVLGVLGVDADATDYVAVGSPSTRVQALAVGRVDATTASYGSFLPVAETPGIHILVTPEEFYKAAPVQSKFVVGLEATLEEKREPIKRFVAALAEASRLFEDNPEKWVDLMVEGRDDLSREDLEKAVMTLEGRWCVNACMGDALLRSSLDFLYEGADFADVKVIPLEDIVDMSFVAAAKEELGPYNGTALDAQ